MVSTMEINVVNSNNFKSSKDSRETLILKLSLKEQKMFKEFVKSFVRVKYYLIRSGVYG